MMRRREFITLLGGAAAWPVAARAQQGDRVRRIGVLLTYDENDPLAKAQISAFTQTLAGLGWTDGRNVRMDLRGAGGDTNRIRALAQELVVPSSGRRGRSRSSLQTWAIPSRAASSRG
jgi:putative ABC transport system substrate-binding protein